MSEAQDRVTSSLGLALKAIQNARREMLNLDSHPDIVTFYNNLENTEKTVAARYEHWRAYLPSYLKAKKEKKV